MEKFIFVISKFDSLDSRVSSFGSFDTKEEAEKCWSETIVKNLDQIHEGYSYYIESLRIA
jgi:hypothetical protein